MRKQLIAQNIVPTINISGISTSSIVAIEARMTETHSYVKYILQPVGGQYRFVTGNGGWDSDRDLAALIKRVIEDVRVKAYVFDSMEDLGQWIKE
jgi:hypothetical protein